MTLVRRASRWVSNDGSVQFIFPKYNLTRRGSQKVQVPNVPTIGSDYSFPYLAASIAPKVVASITVSFLMVSTATPPTGLDLDASLDLMTQTLMNGGMGKLYTTDDAGTERWAWAICTSVPDDPFTDDNRYSQPVTLAFDRYSDWFITTVGSVVITVSGQTFTIANPGTAYCYNLVFTLTPSNLASSPSFFNTSAPLINNTQQFVEYNTAGAGATLLNASTRRLLISGRDVLAQVSTNSGVTYTDDYKNIIRTAGMTNLMPVLIPGSNSWQAIDSGTPHYTLGWSFDAPFHR